MSLFERKEVAFGLDISDHSLRMVQLHKLGKKISVQLYNEIKLTSQCVEGGEIKNQKSFLESLQKLLKTRHGHGKLSDEVIGVLPEEKTFIKIIEIPTISNKSEEILDQIKKILPQHIPIDIEKTYIDWQTVKKNKENQIVLVGVCPKQIIDSYVNVLTMANLIPTVLEIESVAISRALLDLELENQPPQIIIDMGANRTGLFLYDKDTIKFTVSLPISGNKITQLITDTLDLDFEKAEQAKKVCGLDQNKCHGALLEIFSDTIAELEKHIIEAINFYYNNFPGAQKVAKIIICGGSANLINVAQILQNKINIPVEISNPWHNIKNPDPKYFNQHKSQSFTTSIGLALRGLNPETFL